jgi:hypothetical protein
MLDTLCRLVRQRTCLLVVLAAGLFPGAADAEVIKVVNTTTWPVVLQASILVRGVPRLDRPYQVLPGGEVVLTLPAGDRVLTITDARNPNRTLFRNLLPNSPTNQLYHIVPEGVPPGLNVVVQPTPPAR